MLLMRQRKSPITDSQYLGVMTKLYIFFQITPIESSCAHSFFSFSLTPAIEELQYPIDPDVPVMSKRHPQLFIVEMVTADRIEFQ